MPVKRLIRTLYLECWVETEQVIGHFSKILLLQHLQISSKNCFISQRKTETKIFLLWTWHSNIDHYDYAKSLRIIVDTINSLTKVCNHFVSCFVTTKVLEMDFFIYFLLPWGIFEIMIEFNEILNYTCHPTRSRQFLSCICFLVHMHWCLHGLDFGINFNYSCYWKQLVTK